MTIHQRRNRVETLHLQIYLPRSSPRSPGRPCSTASFTTMRDESEGCGSTVWGLANIVNLRIIRKSIPYLRTPHLRTPPPEGVTNHSCCIGPQHHRMHDTAVP